MTRVGGLQLYGGNFIQGQRASGLSQDRLHQHSSRFLAHIGLLLTDEDGDRAPAPFWCLVVALASGPVLCYRYEFAHTRPDGFWLHLALSPVLSP